MEQKAKERNRREERNYEEEEGVIYSYKVKCNDCKKIYIGKTKFGMGKWIIQHRKDVECERIDYNAIARHVKEEGHKIVWQSAVVLVLVY